MSIWAWNYFEILLICQIYFVGTLIVVNQRHVYDAIMESRAVDTTDIIKNFFLICEVAMNDTN